MGLLSFLKNVGANVFRGGKKDEEIKKLLADSLGELASGIDVEFDDDEDKVVLSGQVDSQATKEKAALIAGNVKGVESVDDSDLTWPQPEEEEEEPVEFYTIVSGDSLSKIAKRHYGDAMKYPALFEANREVIKNPDLIYPGQVIRIPKLTD